MLASVLMINQIPTAGTCSNYRTARHIPDGFRATPLQREYLFLLPIAIRISAFVRSSFPFSATLPAIFDPSSLISGAGVAHHPGAVTRPALLEILLPVYAAKLALSNVRVRTTKIILIHTIQYCIQLIFRHHY